MRSQGQNSTEYQKNFKEQGIVCFLYTLCFILQAKVDTESFYTSISAMRTHGCLLLCLFFSSLLLCCESYTCPAIIDIPGDLRLGACNSTTLCENPCTGIICSSSPSDCNIYQCIFGICQRTGVKPGCCNVDGDCFDGNQCTTDLCISNICNFVVGVFGCQRDYDCPSVNQACFNCTCLPKPTAVCFNSTSNTTYPCSTAFCNNDVDCNDNNPCTIDTCQPNNRCDHITIATCCRVNDNCQTNVTTCNRISRCQNNTCVISPTDNDSDGIPCPQDCNDNNPAIGGPSTYYMDVDGDGFGSNIPIQSCTLSNNIVNVTGDCQDSNPCVYPGNYRLCWDTDVGNCNYTFAPKTHNPIVPAVICVDPLANSVFFTHQNLNDTGPDGYTGNQTIGLRSYQRMDITQKFTLLQENKVANQELYLWSRDVVSETTALRVDHEIDSLTGIVMPSIYQDMDIFTTEAISLDDGSFIIVYGWFDNSSGLVTIKMAVQTTGPTVPNFTIAATSPLSGYVIFGRPSIAINVNSTVLVTYQLYNPTLNVYAIAVTYNQTGVLSTTLWSTFILLSSLYYEPTPVMRLINNKPSILFAYGWNISSVITPSFSYCVSVTGTGLPPYAFTNITFPLFVGAPFELDMISLSDARPMMVGRTMGSPYSPTPIYMVTACLPTSQFDYLFSGWNCYQIEQGEGISASLVAGHAFISYWSTFQRLEESNQAYAFDVAFTRLKYATSCKNIPSVGTWKIFGLPSSSTFPSNTIQNSTLGYFSSFSHRTSVMPSTFNGGNTIAISSSNILGVEIDQ